MRVVMRELSRSETVASCFVTATNWFVVWWRADSMAISLVVGGSAGLVVGMYCGGAAG